MSCYGVLKVCIRTLSGTARARAGTSLAVIAQELHLFPFRTEKLSPAAPMVLGAQAPGRVGRRQFSSERPANAGLSSFSGPARPRRAQTVDRARARRGSAARSAGASRRAAPAG